MKKIKNKKAQLSVNAIVMITLGVTFVIFGLLIVMKIMSNIPAPGEESEMLAPTVFSSQAYPSEGVRGTIFKIIAEVPEVNAEDVYSVDAKIGKDIIVLYDNGLHGDSASGDGIYSGIFDSSKIETSGELIGNVAFNSKTETAYESSFSFKVVDNACRYLLINGNPADKIDVVVLGQDYKTNLDFEKDVEKYLDLSGENEGIFAYAPFEKNKIKFNLYYVNNNYSSDDLGCELGCRGVESAVCCNDRAVAKAAAQCPSDQIIVLINKNNFCGSASSYAKVCTQSNSPMVLVHEFGHTFGGLGDEYDYGIYPGMKKIRNYNFPNCVDDCSKWPSGVTAGCFEGCGYSNYYRSSETDSIMYTYTSMFNSVSKYYLEKIFEKYTVKFSDYALNDNKESKKYLSELIYKNGALVLNQVFVVPGDYSENKNNKNEYIAKIVALDGKTLYTSTFDISNLLFNFFDASKGINSETENGVLEEEEANYTLALPYFDNAKKVEIYNSTGKLLEIDVAYFSKTCGNGKCEETESYEDCAMDCSKEEMPAPSAGKSNAGFWIFGVVIILTGAGIYFYLKSRKQKNPQNRQKIQNFK